MSYLNEFHPEVFVTRPRPGGLAVIQPPSKVGQRSSSKNVPGKGSRVTIRSDGKSVATKSSKGTLKSSATSAFFDTSLDRTSAPKRTTREFRINKILTSSPWHLYQDDDTESETEPVNNPLPDSMYILSTAISTIMLMAAQYPDIPRQHLVWTQSYLQCIKDGFGEYPPNVRGLMNNIKLIDNTLTSFFEDWEEDDKSDIAPAFAVGASKGTVSTGANTVPTVPPPKADAEQQSSPPDK